MGDKNIYLAGRPIPIKTDGQVSTFMDGGPSFYTPEGHASPHEIQNMKTRRPNGRVYSSRRAPGRVWLKAGPHQFNQVTPEEILLLQQTVVQIAVHHDVTLDYDRTFGVLVSRGLSSHFIINHDGNLYQPLDMYHSAWATGDNNNGCVAIDLNNPVKLEFAARDPANPPRQVFKGKINGSMKVMLGYTEAQYATFIALLKAFITPLRYDGISWTPLPTVAQHCFPPLDEEGKVITRLLRGHLGFQGFLGHWHCSSNKWDPGPALDWLRVLAGIHGDRNYFPVILPGYGNLPDLNGQSLQTALQAYYANIESNETGGWYPIGSNQSWHSGVHIHVDEGTPVMSMSKGTIVAVRNAKKVDLGNPGFVVIRHEMAPSTVTVEGEEPEPIVWFSIYMHLKTLKSEDQLVDVPWAQTLLGGDFTPPQGSSYSFDMPDPNSIPHEKRPPQVADATDIGEFILETKRKPFWDGDILLCEIPVKGGEVIGYAGVFGSSEWSQEPQVHVEAVAPKEIFRDAQKETQRSFVLVEGDPDSNSRVDIQKVLAPIYKASAGYSNKEEDKERVLKTSEIQSFFVDASMMAERKQMRRMVCYHQSEWSNLTDWTRTAPSAVGWQWETQEAFSRWIITWFPFQWLNDRVASHLGLGKEHKLFTYHPIHLLEVLNRSYTVTTKGTAEAADESEILANQSEIAARKERLAELQAKRAGGTELSEEESAEYDALYALMDDDHERDVAEVGYNDMTWDFNTEFDTWEPGEWEPPKVKKEESPYGY